MKILVAEDNETLRQILCGHLIDCRHAAYQASNGTMALEFVRDHKFDLVITDYSMPGATGIDVIRMVKRHSPETKIWFMSGDDFSTTLALEAAQAGADRIFSKPNLYNELRVARII